MRQLKNKQLYKLLDLVVYGIPVIITGATIGIWSYLIVKYDA